MTRIRRRFAPSCIISADHFSCECEASEKSTEKRDFLSALEETKSYAIAAVLTAVTFLESVINEVFGDAVEGLLEEELDSDVSQKLADIWMLPTFNRLSTLDKYQLSLSVVGKPVFETGKNPYQDAKLLIQLRNLIVHSKPECSDLIIEADQANLKLLEKKLKGKFIENTLATGSAFPFFPDRCLGAGYANWSASTSSQFFYSYCRIIGISDFRSRGWNIIEFSS